MREPSVSYEGAYGAVVNEGFEISFPKVLPASKPLEAVDNITEVLSNLHDRSIRTKRGVIIDASNVLYRSRKIAHANQDGMSGLFWRSMLAAYNDHHPVALRPEVLWQIIMNQVGIYVRQNADECASYFTRTPSQQQSLNIAREHGESWEDTLLKMRPEFERHIEKSVLEAFLPKFTTSSAESEVATLLTFMDTVSMWYAYGVMPTCGFPKILLSGEPRDWVKLSEAVNGLSGMFAGLRYYFADLVDVLHDIITAVKTQHVNPEFWGSMFRYHSFSQIPAVDGWLSALIAYRVKIVNKRVEFVLRGDFNWRTQFARGSKLEFREIPQGINFASVSFKEPAQGEDLLLMTGVLGSEFDSYLTPRLGFVVAKVE